ncbi:MAG: ABC transporter ATP-binding protein, partial [Actinomycetales bacterium]|nr:ABC transporter ATP-binding protein [Actinomycetales bacterium]
FQNYALFPHMSAKKNIRFGLEMRKVPAADQARRVDAAVGLVRLQQHADKLPGQLSGGQQQRVAIARAIVIEPPLVLMDEPLSNLDAKLRLEMRTEIRRLHQTLGLTTIYVTHDQEEALSMADRLVVLREGRVQQIGTPEELHNSPVNWHVADFMGYRNITDVTVASATGGRVVVDNADLHLRATAVEDVAAGETARLAIRPEDFRIVEPGGEPLGSNTVKAQVAVVEYHGREFSVGVTTPSGATLHVRSDYPPTPGDQVTLTVDPARALVFRLSIDELHALSPEEQELAEVRQ